ncbi:MAG TPA: TIGR03435 family protein [Bryobacteraceae bacterium]|nr:TIGR03435 family protein [Bryobacteraceae bacterium]
MALAGMAWGQAFEVATIKRSDMAADSGQMIRDPRLVALSHVSLQNLMAQAYLIRNFQISGPDWLDTDRFDIVAKLPDGATRDQLPAMLQSLLKERFHLTMHQDKKTMTAFVLAPGNDGVKMKAIDSEVRDVRTARGAHLWVAGKLTIAYFAGLLSNLVDQPVVDETGLKGVYDIDIEWASDETAGMDGTPSLSAVLADKLGLRLDSRKAPVDIYVIDRLDRAPTEN